MQGLITCRGGACSLSFTIVGWSAIRGSRVPLGHARGSPTGRHVAEHATSEARAVSFGSRADQQQTRTFHAAETTLRDICFALRHRGGHRDLPPRTICVLALGIGAERRDLLIDSHDRPAAASCHLAGICPHRLPIGPTRTVRCHGPRLPRVEGPEQPVCRARRDLVVHADVWGRRERCGRGAHHRSALYAPEFLQELGITPSPRPIVRLRPPRTRSSLQPWS